MKNKDVLKQPVFDSEDFLERIDGDIELMNEVIVIFRKDTPNLLNELYKAIRKKDVRAVERAAHTLKGATANISARRMQKLSQYIQQILKKKDRVSLEPFIDDFRESFEELDRVLGEHLNK